MTSYWLPCSPISPNVHGWRGSAIFLLQLFSFLIKTSCLECQQGVRKSERHVERQTDRQTDRKTEPLFSLGVKTKVVLNVNRMSER